MVHESFESISPDDVYRVCDLRVEDGAPQTTDTQITRGSGILIGIVFNLEEHPTGERAKGLDGVRAPSMSDSDMRIVMMGLIYGLFRTTTIRLMTCAGRSHFCV